MPKIIFQPLMITNPPLFIGRTFFTAVTLFCQPYAQKGQVTLFCQPYALKGQKLLAQGIALGNDAIIINAL